MPMAAYASSPFSSREPFFPLPRMRIYCANGCSPVVMASPINNRLKTVGGFRQAGQPSGDPCRPASKECIQIEAIALFFAELLAYIAHQRPIGRRQIEFQIKATYQM